VKLLRNINEMASKKRSADNSTAAGWHVEMSRRSAEGTQLPGRWRTGF
jgi:hypothetical protein